MKQLIRILIVVAMAITGAIAIATDDTTGSFTVSIKIIPTTVLTITNSDVRFPDTKLTDGMRITSSNELEGRILVTANEGGQWQLMMHATSDFKNQTGTGSLPIENLSCMARVNGNIEAETMITKEAKVVAKGQGSAENLPFGIRFFLQNLPNYNSGDYQAELVLTLATPVV